MSDHGFHGAGRRKAGGVGVRGWVGDDGTFGTSSASYPNCIHRQLFGSIPPESKIMLEAYILLMEPIVIISFRDKVINLEQTMAGKKLDRAFLPRRPLKR